MSVYISTRTMSRPALPQSVWLHILGQLDYRTLKFLQTCNRSFKRLVRDSPALDEAMFRDKPSAAKDRAALGENGVMLHPLLNADDAAHDYPHVRWYMAPAREIDVASRKARPVALGQMAVQHENATSPPVTRLVLAQAWDFVRPEPVQVHNPRGVTVGDVADAWCKLTEEALAHDYDDSVIRALEALEEHPTHIVEWDIDIWTEGKSVVEVELGVWGTPWAPWHHNGLGDDEDDEDIFGERRHKKGKKSYLEDDFEGYDDYDSDDEEAELAALRHALRAQGIPIPDWAQ